jgi:hypothetical protein
MARTRGNTDGNAGGGLEALEVSWHERHDGEPCVARLRQVKLSGTFDSALTNIEMVRRHHVE